MQIIKKPGVVVKQGRTTESLASPEEWVKVIDFPAAGIAAKHKPSKEAQMIDYMSVAD